MPWHGGRGSEGMQREIQDIGAGVKIKIERRGMKR